MSLILVTITLTIIITILYDPWDLEGPTLLTLCMPRQLLDLSRLAIYDSEGLPSVVIAGSCCMVYRRVHDHCMPYK